MKDTKIKNIIIYVLINIIILSIIAILRRLWIINSNSVDTSFFINFTILWIVCIVFILKLSFDAWHISTLKQSIANTFITIFFVFTWFVTEYVTWESFFEDTRLSLILIFVFITVGIIVSSMPTLITGIKKLVTKYD